jgi:hypothetical protein
MAQLVGSWQGYELIARLIPADGIWFDVGDERYEFLPDDL